MRVLFSIVVSASLFITACSNRSGTQVKTGPTNSGLVNNGDTTTFTSIQWTDSSKNYGKITEGQQLEVNFVFRNVGNKPLVIYRIQPSCGCTAAEPPKEPIAPGGMGEIKATFNSSGKSGLQHKTLYVNANTTGTQDHALVFEVEVDKK